jgi:ABC-type lipoprotein release transport system permease subunit
MYGLLHLGPGDVRAINILGINPSKYSKVTGFKKSLLNQKNRTGEPNFAVDSFPEGKGGFVSIGVLGKPDEQTDEYDFEQVKNWLGKEVVLTTGVIIEKEQTGGADKKARQFRQKHLKFRIADIVFTGTHFRDSENVYLPIEQVRDLKKTGSANRCGPPYEEIKIKLAGGVEPQKMIEPIRRVWDDFTGEYNLAGSSAPKPFLKTSTQAQEYFVAELRKQMAVLMLIFGIVCSAVTLLIFCIFYMIVVTKQTDIAVIKSCGTTSSSVALIFLGFGICVGAIGSISGTLLGYVVISNINIIEQWIRVIFGLKLWKSSVYVFEKIPNQLDISSSCWIILFAVIAAAVGSLAPAILAARTKPVQILRYE